MYLEGTLLSVRASDPEVFQAVCEQARPIAMGKNFSLANFWCVPNDSMRLTTGGVVPAFHMRKLVSFADKDKFAVAVCGGEHPNVIMIQMPVLEYEEINDLEDDMTVLDYVTE